MPASAEVPSARRIRGTSRLVGIIGWPVGHSLSPAIHNAAFRAMDMDWVYVPLPVEPGYLPAAVDGLRSLGFAGANVTMPHKTEAAALVDARSDDAERLRAVNTVVVGEDAILGHNTDVTGFERFLSDDIGFDPAGKVALVFGAGGAARACALALARGNLARLVVVARDAARAQAVVEAVEGLPTEVSVVSFDSAPHELADLVVNATPLGASGEALSTPPLGSGSVVVDLLYEPAVTPLLASARSAGAPNFGGLGLLLHQAALSFELWTGRRPPLESMSAAALGELGEPG